MQWLKRAKEFLNGIITGSIVPPNNNGVQVDQIQVKGADVILPSTGIYYIGDPDTSGSFRIKRDNTDLVIERLISSTWTICAKITN